ncbi:MAG: TIGR03663 family protein [Alphaproteobacteria bacterium]|nr:TIGR03663 family protein [Alphaproteobacteria bacterium]
MTRGHALFALACAVGLLLRVVAPELRPIHHDEAVNWFIAGRILNRGFYAYDPANYHGPLHHYVDAVGRLLGPDSLVSLRLPTMLVGASMPAMAWGLRHRLGERGALALAWALAVSPSLVYYARDAIHETLLVASTLGLVVATDHWLRTGGRARAAAVGALLAAMLATKETAILTFGGLAVGLAVAVAAGARPALRERWRETGAWAVGSAVLVLLVLFSGFGRDPAGVVGLVTTWLHWGARGAEGGGHASSPWWEFLHLLGRYEGAMLVVAVLGAPAAVRRRDPFGLGLLAWGLAVAAVYSAIPYKTPWCVLNLVIPLALFVGWSAGRAPGGWVAPVGALLTLVSAGLAVDVAFVRHDDPDEPLVYVQTRREVEAVAQILRDVHTRDAGATVRRLHPARYPLNWYLRGTGIGYRPEDGGVPDPVDGDVLLALPRERARVRAGTSRAFRVRDFPFRGHLGIAVWVAEDRLDLVPAAREWDRVTPLLGDFVPPAIPAERVEGWRVSWYRGTGPDGEPERVETLPVADVRWPGDREKPHKAPHFVRWEGWLDIAEEGTYAFSAKADDGSRLWIDGRLVVDRWQGTVWDIGTGVADLAPGLHHLRLDWGDTGGPASLRLAWTPPGRVEEVLASKHVSSVPVSR